MREEFSGWYFPDGAQKDELWKNAWFIVDASVLLNLYKYPESARSDLLLALGKVKSRLWLPYQAALEYQQNRLGVVADQVKKFDDAAKVVKDFKNKLTSELGHLQLAKRHSAINPTKLLEGIESQAEVFLRNLDDLKQKQPRVDSADQIRSHLDELFHGRIGPRPADQSVLDTIYSEAEERYRTGIPPGFQDERSKDDSVAYSHGLRYVKKYGDLILWRQILDFVGTQAQKSIILMTDDEKADWWHIVESQGTHRLGPHVLLAEEFAERTGGANILLHTSEQFLFEAQTRLKLKVSTESINQLRDIAEADADSAQQFSSGAVAWSFFHLLKERHNGHWIQRRHFFPDFIVEEPNCKLAYDLKFLRRPEPGHIFPILEQAHQGAVQYIEASTFNRFVLAIVVLSIEDAKQVRRGWIVSKKRLSFDFPIEIFVLSQDDDDEYPRLQLHELLTPETVE